MHRRIRFVSLLSALCALPLTAASVTAGPPWISVEYPSNPHDRTTRNAAFLVHAYHHGDHILPTLSATLEGLVDGRRRTIEATVERTSRRGVYAVRAERPGEGAWIAVVRMRQGDAPATALVTLGARNAVLAVDVPVERREGWHIPRDVGEADIAAALRNVRALAVSDAAEGTGTEGGTALAGAALVLVLLVSVARRQARPRDTVA